MNRISHLLTSACVAAILSGCASQSNGPNPEGNPLSEAAPDNDFPTQARVEYVFQCMRDHGGQNYDNLYHCSCMVDELAKHMSYQEFSEAIVFKNLRSMPGEQGGVFRDPPQAKALREKLKEVEQTAQEVCFVK